MQNFAKHRGGADGPPNPENAPSNRKTMAANAKLKTRPSSRQGNPVQAPLNTVSRGLENAQNTSAAIQHAPARRASGQKQKHDPYDTDAESIDTTVNQSVIQVEDSQHAHRQTHPQPDPVINFDENKSEASDDEEGDEEDEEDDDDEHADNVITHEESKYLQEQGQGHLTYEEAIAFLNRTRRHGFPTIDGDSYPTTTEGDPSEWQGDQELPSEDYEGDGLVSPSPQHPKNRVQAPGAPFRPVNQGFNRTKDRPHTLFNQGAALRNQQRATNGLAQQPLNGHKNNVAPLPSSQPPTYSQVTHQLELAQAPNPQLRANHHVAFQQPHQPRQPAQDIPRQTLGAQHTTPPPKPLGSRVPAKQPLTARTKEVPIIQQPPVEQAPAEQMEAQPDYDAGVLHDMTYDQLKNESFDTDPRAPDQPLPEDVRQKPLVERLEHVQKTLKPEQQATFFRLLPTTEWEDAGDWFLQEFSSIIARTKEARQKKRKLAEGFEDEIEKRHKHVSKKQQQVEEAMKKMKAQGEGLVPRSPRPSKSPRPKKG
jgi:hypothetical protein